MNALEILKGKAKIDAMNAYQLTAATECAPVLDLFETVPELRRHFEARFLDVLGRAPKLSSPCAICMKRIAINGDLCRHCATFDRMATDDLHILPRGRERFPTRPTITAGHDAGRTDDRRIDSVS